ncbi:hypothetical protein [Rhodococcoides kyotonense]|uniref:Uncharacterized protein n=1 Tax=Rhodococcoides kyotonense TaxID=398843 RepID=A0A239MEL4_9NOCA|nr:hypothetical protein [Rhodococcus kyotonensis]SNT40940.1 hypothetical protein SAMN05421642_117107 [Rhodococcus kyotonensis]
MTGRDKSGDRGHTAALRAARREVARTHHPDLGGDPDTYIRLLAELECRHISTPGTATVHGASRRTLRHAAWRRTIDAVRRRIQRRYIELP